MPGVEVGHATLIEGEGPLEVGKGPVRTGVTAILPLGKKTTDAVVASRFLLNGTGETAGTERLDELGMIFGPVVLTNTLGIGTAQTAVVEWNRRRGEGSGAPPARSLPVVAGTWDGFLNDIQGRHLTGEHVVRALESARSGPVEEGNVGGGTGTRSFDFKSGIGTSSRVVTTQQGRFTLGVIVQPNFGQRPRLRIAGVSVGENLTGLAPESPMAEQARKPVAPAAESIIVVIATDAPLLAGQLERVARRAAMALGRGGGISTHGPGDVFLAFSTGNRLKSEGSEVHHLRMIADVDPLFDASAQATEEAFVNALVAANTMKGIDGNVAHALPHEQLQDVLRGFNRFQGSPQSLDEINNEVHKASYFLPYAPGESLFVTEYYTVGSLTRQPARAIIFLTGPEFLGNFVDIPVEGYSGPAMAAQRGFFAYTLDYVGVGKSHIPEDGSKITYLTNAAAVDKLIDHVRQSRRVARVDLFGEHFGGEVASALAKENPDSVRSVVMSTMNYKEINSELVALLYTPVAEAFFRSHSDGYWKPDFLLATLTYSFNADLRAYVLATQSGTYPTGSFLQYWDPGLPVIDAVAQQVPLLLLAGEHDAFLAPGDMENLAADWGGGANLVVIPGGHKAPRIGTSEIAGRYFQEIFSFLDP